MEQPVAVPFAEERPFPLSSAYTPRQIALAYNDRFNEKDGADMTVALIGAFGADGFCDDVAYFRKTFRLGKKTADMRFPFGRQSPVSLSQSLRNTWALEITADAQWLSAACPACEFFAVFSKDNTASSLMEAVRYAVKNGADVVSMSFGIPEFEKQVICDRFFETAPCTFVASSGNVGGQMFYPSASPYVLSIGGTALHLKKDGSVISRTALENAGGGISAYSPMPLWQRGFAPLENMTGGFRASPDLALDASVNPGYAVYFQGVWHALGGTSLTAPIFSGAVARLLSKNKAVFRRTRVSEYLYTLAGKTAYTHPNTYFYDIVTGSSGPYFATVGYDFATGLGAPDIGNLLQSTVIP